MEPSAAGGTNAESATDSAVKGARFLSDLDVLFTELDVQHKRSLRTRVQEAVLQHI